MTAHFSLTPKTSMCSLKTTPIQTAVKKRYQATERLGEEGIPHAGAWHLQLYDKVQARIDTGLDLQCFPARLAFWQGTVAMKEVLCYIFSSLPPDNLRLGVLATLMLH